MQGAHQKVKTETRLHIQGLLGQGQTPFPSLLLICLSLPLSAWLCFSVSFYVSSASVSYHKAKTETRLHIQGSLQGQDQAPFPSLLLLKVHVECAGYIKRTKIRHLSFHLSSSATLPLSLSLCLICLSVSHTDPETLQDQDDHS